MAYVSRGVLHQYVAGVAACLSMLASGSCYGWMTPILSHLMSPNSEIPVTSAQLPWIASVIELGNLFSPIPAGVLINYNGRKPVLLATMPVYIVGWMLILYYPTAEMLVVSRTLQGVAMGAVFTVTPVYLGEIASEHTRGAITSMFYNSWWLGFLIEYAVGPFLSFYPFTYFTIALHVPFLVLFLWQPESPYYYVMAGEVEKAQKALKWFRDSSPEKLKEELEEIQYSVEESKKSAGLRDLVANVEDRRALCILNILTALRALTGNGALVVYATQIFNMTPNLSIAPDMVTIAVGAIMFFGGCVSSFTLDSFGRRPLLLISCVGSLHCQFIAGTYYFLLTNTDVVVSTFSWLAPVLILVYSGLCTAGMFPVVSAYTSELFNTNARGVASSIGAINVTIVSFVILMWYQPVTDYFGLYANFYLYALFCLLISVYSYFYAIETKGKTFLQIRKELS